MTLRRFADWTRAADPTAEIDGCISRLMSDKHAHEERVVELLNVEAAGECAIEAARCEIDRAHELRDAEQVLADEDQREVDLLLDERARLPRRLT